MCGIFAYLSKSTIEKSLKDKLITELIKTKHRGPDNTKYRLENKNIFLGFHRLCVNDISEKGDQPLTHPTDFNITVICNGEIYNYSQLKIDYSIITHSTSDCEIILHLYKKFGFHKTISLLDGVFACVLVDLTEDIVYAARDPLGVRSMYIGENSEGNIGFSSELKSIHELCDTIKQFKPGHIWNSKTEEYTKYFSRSSKTHADNEEVSKHTLKTKLETAVTKRTMSDRKIGCLLSGGLDSSLIAALLSNNYKEKLETFSIGLEGSPDLKYAKIVAEHIKSNHHEVIVTDNEMLNAIDKVIYQIETYDTTTIRAATPMFLLSEYIKNNTDIAVIYSGEGSDEASGSYLYFHNAPNITEFKTETFRLLDDLCYFDVLRCDKSTAGSGLEVRVPFLDKDFLDYYMSIDPKYKIASHNGIEKWLLRSAFDDGKLLPDSVLWRTKEAMSDGVSSQKKGWFEIIQENVDRIYTDQEFDDIKENYKWNPPMFKEALYYRELFNKHYPGRDKTIPYYWLPKWSGDVVDPSARMLTDVYKSE